MNEASAAMEQEQRDHEHEVEVAGLTGADLLDRETVELIEHEVDAGLGECEVCERRPAVYAATDGEIVGAACSVCTWYLADDGVVTHVWPLMQFDEAVAS